MKLQLALDRLTRDTCFKLIDETIEFIDLIEVGTGVIKEHGMSIIREISELYPNKTIVADMKTCDAGRHEAEQAFTAGADITTVMAFSADKTIKEMQTVANNCGKQIMVDLLGVNNKQRIEELVMLGVDFVSLHIGKDQQTTEKFAGKMFTLIEGFDVNVSVAGGICLATLPEIVQKKPAIIIVGSAITAAENPMEQARKIKTMLHSVT